MAGGSASRDLTQAEQSFIAQVSYQLRHLPESRQAELGMQARKILLTGVPADAYRSLEREFGAPADFADKLQRSRSHEHGAAGKVYQERRAKAAKQAGNADNSDGSIPATEKTSSSAGLFITIALVVVVIIIALIMVL